MATPRCAAQTKAGKPCRAAPLSGADFCSAHDPSRPDETRFGSPAQAAQAGSAPKPRALKLSEALTQRALERADEILDQLFAAVEAQRVVVVGSGDAAEAELHPDYPTQLRAISEIFDRVEGRPRQALEHTGEGGGPVVLDVLGGADPAGVSPATRRKIAKALEQEHHAHSNGGGH